MHVVIILLILFILLYCFAIFPEMSRQKRMKAFHGIMFAHATPSVPESVLMRMCATTIICLRN